jgi:hypothetical protein
MSISIILRILKFSVLNTVVTFMAGWLLRIILPFIGSPFIDYPHFWGNLLFVLPSWAVTLWVFWLLARRHPAGYWYVATSVGALSTLIALALGYLMNPEAMKPFLTLKSLVSQLFWQSVVIVIAAILSRRVKYDTIAPVTGAQAPKENLTMHSNNDAQ